MFKYIFANITVFTNMPRTHVILGFLQLKNYKYI